MKRLVVTAAIAAALATFAPPAQAQPFTGPSVGAEIAQEDFGTENATTAALVAGWDIALDDAWRVGAGVRWTFSDVDEQRTEPVGANVQDISVAFRNRVGVSARVGRVFGQSWLAYGEIGQEWFDVDAVRVLRAPVCVPPTQCVISRLDGSFEETMTSIGVGIDWAATDHVRIRSTVSRGESDAFDRNRFAVSAHVQF
jgi:outer membrane receptor protein involved in Fe transport